MSEVIFMTLVIAIILFLFQFISQKKSGGDIIEVDWTMKNLVHEGNPVLREVAKEVPVPLLEEDIEIMIKMLNLVKASQDPRLSKKHQLRPAICISAPQFGIAKRMIAVSFPNWDGSPDDYALFNPRIIEKSEEMVHLQLGESCISVQRKVKGLVPRHAKIKVEAMTIEHGIITFELKDHLAIIMQHEIDHLEGHMFYDLIDKDNPMCEPVGSNSLAPSKTTKRLPW